MCVAVAQVVVVVVNGGRARVCVPRRGAERDARKLVGNSSLYRPLRHTGNARDRFTTVRWWKRGTARWHVSVVPREAVLAWPARSARKSISGLRGASERAIPGSVLVASTAVSVVILSRKRA